MPTWTEQDMENAGNDVSNGKPLRTAAKDWGIPHTTLMHRLAPGRKTCREAKQEYQRLSVSQERSLAAWAISQAELGFPVTRPEIKAFALKVLAAQGDTRGLSKRWIELFMGRHPTITVKSLRNDGNRYKNARLAKTRTVGEARAEAGARTEAGAVAQIGAGVEAGSVAENGSVTEAGSVAEVGSVAEDESVAEVEAVTETEAGDEAGDEAEMEVVDLETPARENNDEDVGAWES